MQLPTKTQNTKDNSNACTAKYGLLLWVSNPTPYWLKGRLHTTQVLMVVIRAHFQPQIQYFHYTKLLLAVEEWI